MMQGLIFDIDGVLIDVRGSFHATIKYTVYIYLSRLLNISVAENIVSDEDIFYFKNLGGFNDDWDLSAGLLYYLVSLYDPITKQAIAKKDVAAFTAGCCGPGLKSILKHTQSINCEWIKYETRDDEQLSDDNLVKRVFQEIYWGPEEFFKIYQQEPQFYNQAGMVNQEKALISKTQLEGYVQQGFVLSIATGRERNDALYSLEKFGFLPLFDYIVTLSDVGQERKKPHPYSLFSIQEWYQEQKACPVRYLYVGDQLDDMDMALRAQKEMNVEPLGFLHMQDDYKNKAMVDRGVKHIFSNHEDLYRWITLAAKR